MLAETMQIVARHPKAAMRRVGLCLGVFIFAAFAFGLIRAILLQKKGAKAGICNAKAGGPNNWRGRGVQYAAWLGVRGRDEEERWYCRRFQGFLLGASALRP